jgi:hypothetical protein
VLAAAQFDDSHFGGCIGSWFGSLVDSSTHRSRDDGAVQGKITGHDFPHVDVRMLRNIT